MKRSLHALDLARRQALLDRAMTRSQPQLLKVRRARLSATPHAFFRGSARLFYEILRRRPDLVAGPAGRGWIVGDMHLENVGAYRTDERTVVFDLNDFDDVTEGPWRLDVLRLTCSILLASRVFQATGTRALGFAEAMLEGYSKGAFSGRRAARPPVPEPIRRLVQNVSARSSRQLLDGRAPRRAGRRRFVHGPRYLPLSLAIHRNLSSILKCYAGALGKRLPDSLRHGRTEDAALRVAGTGSLGRFRIAVLAVGQSGKERIYEFKEAGESAVGALRNRAARRALNPATRVVTGARAMTSLPTERLAAVARPFLGRHFVGRRLCPQEDKLDVSRLTGALDPEAIFAYIGWTLGRGHALGASLRPSRPWTTKHMEDILWHALELAGIFEGVFLAYTRLGELQ